MHVNHSETLFGPNGEHINNAESLGAWYGRGEKGIYINFDPKYAHDYACESAFKDDHCRLPPGR